MREDTIMTEWLMIAALTLSGSCFAIGGTGFKWVRRYILPILLGVCCFFAKIALWKIGCFVVSLSVILHLGYGERTPYLLKAAIFSGYGLACAWLGFSWFIIISPLLIIALFYLSNNKLTSSIFVWKICEFLMGTYIGCIVANIIAKVKI